MSKFAMSIVLAGLSSFVVGCSDSGSSSVDSSTTSSKGDETVVASSEASTATTPLDMNLTEPAPAEDSASTDELIIGDTAPQISIGKWVKGDAVEHKGECWPVGSVSTANLHHLKTTFSSNNNHLTRSKHNSPISIRDRSDIRSHSH